MWQSQFCYKNVLYSSFHPSINIEFVHAYAMYIISKTVEKIMQININKMHSEGSWLNIVHSIFVQLAN